MTPQDLILRCYAEKTGDQWSAFCIDFTLAAQADTLEQAQAKLHSMIEEYIYDAIDGKDKEFAQQLLLRKAPLLERLKYYYIIFADKFFSDFHSTKHGIYKLFNESMPLVPKRI